MESSVFSIMASPELSSGGKAVEQRRWGRGLDCWTAPLIAYMKEQCPLNLNTQRGRGLGTWLARPVK